MVQRFLVPTFVDKNFNGCLRNTLAACYFFLRVADVALKARSLHEQEQKRHLCPLEQTNRLKHHTTTKTNKTRRPANPPARLAFRQQKNKANSKSQKQQKTEPEPKQNTHKSICHETQRLVHCITRKSLPNELISRLSGNMKARAV